MGVALDTMEDEKPSILALAASMQLYAARIKKEAVELEEETGQNVSASTYLGLSETLTSGAEDQSDTIDAISQHGKIKSSRLREDLGGTPSEKDRAQICGVSKSLRDTNFCDKLHQHELSSPRLEVKPDEDGEIGGNTETRAFRYNELVAETGFSISLVATASEPQRKKRHKCHECGKGFVKLGHLIDHHTVHTGAKPYKCDLCNKSFARKTLITLHLRTHSDERPYKCDQCDKTFGQSGNLLIHKRTHSGERPYRCDVCDAGFMKSGDLVRHKRTHLGLRLYGCDMCEKRFARSSSLIIHKRKHSGERPYKCQVCGMDFVSSGHLVRHGKVHSKDKLLIVICGVNNRQK